MDDLRLVQCVRDTCRRPFLLCRSCDRGQIYCSPVCRQRQRARAREISKQRYWRSFHGRLQTATRLQRWRGERQQKETDTGRREVGPKPMVGTRFVTKPAASLQNPVPTAVRLPSGERVDIERLGARFLSALPVIDSASQIATWIVDVPASNPTDDTSTPPSEHRVPDLRPGGTAVLIVRLGEPERLLSVPRQAVTEINTRPYVFVQVDGEHFERRLVTLGRSDGPWVQLVSGVKPKERVVTRGSYDIHLAALMGTIESHRH